MSYETYFFTGILEDRGEYVARYDGEYIGKYATHKDAKIALNQRIKTENWK